GELAYWLISTPAALAFYVVIKAVIPIAAKRKEGSRKPYSNSGKNPSSIYLSSVHPFILHHFIHSPPYTTYEL
ncbi:hypothetical protein, partial [Luteibaculum oceani]|uniref:hypothetical protein n=1 Tax=Luteibaculum oceani TaxID=1294296 RepID=UPI001CB8FA5D